MTRRSLNRIQLVVMALIGCIFLWLAFRTQSLGEIAERIRGAKWTWVALSLGLTFLGHLSRARRWQLLIHSAGNAAGLPACFVSLMTGYLSNLSIPRIGEVSRCASLNRLTNAPVLALGGTVVAERAVDLVSFALLLGLTLIIAGQDAASFFQQHLLQPIHALWSWKLLVLASVGAVGFGLLAWRVLRKRTDGIRGVRAKFDQWTREIWAGLVSALRMRNRALAEFLMHTCLIWASYFAAPLCTLLALGVEDAHVVTTAFYVFVFGSLARTIPLPAGSAGAYHFIVSQWLTFTGYTAVQAITVPTLNHAIQTVFYLVFGVLGLLGLLWMARLNAKKQVPINPQSHPK